MINLRQLQPMELVTRCIFAQNIKEIGAEKIFQTDKKHHVFIVEIDDAWEVDWEFVLFGATSHQFEELFKCFLIKRDVNPTEPSSLVPGTGQPKIILES